MKIDHHAIDRCFWFNILNSAIAIVHIAPSMIYDEISCFTVCFFFLSSSQILIATNLCFLSSTHRSSAFSVLMPQCRNIIKYNWEEKQKKKNIQTQNTEQSKNYDRRLADNFPDKNFIFFKLITWNVNFVIGFDLFLIFFFPCIT